MSKKLLTYIFVALGVVFVAYYAALLLGFIR